MAIQILGADGTSVGGVQPDGSQRTTARPLTALSWISIGESSGLLTGAAAAAAVFSFRYAGTGLLVVRRLQVGFVTTTAFTAAQALAYRLFVARAFTTSDSGGNVITLTGNNGKHRTSLGTPGTLDMRIAAAGALGAGIRTLDTNAIAIAGGTSSAVGASMPITNLVATEALSHQLVLAPNEGLVLANVIAMGAGGVINLYVNIEFAEVTTY